ncbi:hypothetical protein BU24DRAFT_96712 [Aaosphaeria arxii CBS 175.79]|uniref:Uncharacterized protein n=1 Tax=Aaosphaeria arxii CBS 175.79 TaxID=1450172 RepID=A0A6A5X729_9PLEO|nr:uncharacterized protein BU24DRAFT_96712 [Aaosphaeria arxii CBS 175.79]KAF2008720.1 hypothetical protein BU24DRAFT_96712 [Aaosphaeria arxii CBS 175.79]
MRRRGLGICVCWSRCCRSREFYHPSRTLHYTGLFRTNHRYMESSSTTAYCYHMPHLSVFRRFQERELSYKCRI